MASCNVQKVWAPNGEESKLYKEALSLTKDQSQAVELWVSTRTPEFKTLFGDWQSEDFNGNLDENGEPFLNDVVKEEYKLDAETLEVVSREAELYEEKLDKLQQYNSKMRDTLTRKIEDLKRRTSDTKGKDFSKKLETLKSNLKRLEWRESSVKFTNTARTNVKYASSRMLAELSKNNPNVSLLSKYKSYLDAFDLLNDIKAEILSNPLTAESMEDTVNEMNKVIDLKDTAKKKYLDFLEKAVAEKLASLDNKYTAKQLQEFLTRAPFDIKAKERWLRYAGDSRDVVIAQVAKLIDDQQQKIREKSISFTKILSQKIDALEKERSEYKGNAEKLYDPMLEKDSKGNLTGYIVDPEKSPEQYKSFEAKYKDTALFDFYEFFSSEYSRLNDNLPPSFRMGNKLPTVLKSGLERITSSENKLDQAKLFVKNKLVKSNTDISTGELTDDAGRVVRNVPIHFTQMYDSAAYNEAYNKILKVQPDISEEEAHKMAAATAIEQLPKSLSFDLASSLQMFQYMSENYKHMTDIVDYVEGARQLVYEREAIKSTSSGKALISKLKGLDDEYITMSGSETNAYKMIESLIETQVYGITEVDLGTIAIGNLQLDRRKLANALSSLNSARMVGFNVLAGTANIHLGEGMQWADAFGGEFYSAKDYLFAKTEYTRELSKIAGDIGSRTPKAKINLINESYDILGDYRPEGVGIDNSSTMRRVLNSGSIFFINSIGEHRMQSKVMIAMMKNTEVFNQEGDKTGDLFSAHEAKDGKLSVKEGTYIKVDNKLVEYDSMQRRDMSRKIRTVLRRLHGNYNRQTSAEWQRNAIYGLVGQFRKWINDTWARRWDKPAYNTMAKQDLEGTYISFGKFAFSLLNQLPIFNFETARDWKDMTKHQRANVIRTTFEIGTVMSLAAGSAILASLASNWDDEKDKNKMYALRNLMYLNNRLSTELLAYIDPREAWQLLKSPAASMSTIQLSGEILEQLLPQNWGEVYESGYNKGKNKLLHKTEKMIPLWRQIERMSPDGIKGQLQFYNIN